MILVDYNQLVIANFMQLQKHFKSVDDVERGHLFRHMILTNVRMLSRKFKSEWGEFIFCCDGKNNWRKDIFQHYKANRKKDREKNPQNIDWQSLFRLMDEVRSEIDSELPYKVMSNLACEADDIIAILCKHYHKAGKILIISSDKDFIQLHKYHNVSQWSPLSKTFLTVPNPNDFKVNLILKGDRSDGVPNVLSPDDTFVANQRQRKLTKKKLDEWISADNLEAVLEGEHFRNFKRNQKMIDLDYVPEMVEINIITHYNKDHFTGRNKMLNYFIKHRLRELTESIQEF